MRNELMEGASPAFVDFDYLAPSLQDLILDYLEHHSEVTFVDLENDLEEFAGDLSLKMPDHRDTILWRGVSSSGVHAISELARQGRIEFRQTSFRTYQVKGRRLQLPIGRLDAARPHWTPVIVKLRKH